MIFTKRKNKRGDLPIGVYKSKNGKKFGAKQGSTYIGSYNTVEDAFMTYKTEKEKYIKSVADMYKEKIPKNLYNALYNYSVEITD